MYIVYLLHFLEFWAFFDKILVVAKEMAQKSEFSTNNQKFLQHSSIKCEQKSMCTPLLLDFIFSNSGVMPFWKKIITSQSRYFLAKGINRH